MQVLMSKSLEGKVEFSQEAIENTGLQPPGEELQEVKLMASFVFKDEELFENITELDFKHSSLLSAPGVKKITVELKDDFSLIRKLLSGQKLLRIELPYLEYCCKISNPVTYLLNKTNTYIHTLTINMGSSND